MLGVARTGPVVRSTWSMLTSRDSSCGPAAAPAIGAHAPAPRASPPFAAPSPTPASPCSQTSGALQNDKFGSYPLPG
eukprot:7377445-Prymnesium_polylepis.2